MNKKTFLKGAAILGVAGIIVQVMGAIFRIPLANIIGDDGMGYYQTVYPIYIFLLVFSTNGAPAAISKMTSERIAVGKAYEAHRVFRLSFLFMGAFGIVTSCIFFFGAEKIIALMGAHEKSYYAMIAIAPALLLISIMSVYRGYFQGMQDMSPTASSQLIEQAVRVGTGLVLAFVLLPMGIEYAAAGATLGTAIGPIAGIVVLMIIYAIKREKIHGAFERTARTVNGKEKEGAGSIIKTLAAIAIPITVGVSISPIMNLADVFLVFRRLQAAGFDRDDANALFGQLTGMAGPIINIPMALALSMALSMVPAIAAAKSSKDTEFLNINVRLGLRTAMIIGIPCCFGLAILAKPIMRLLYPLQMESAVNAAGCLAILSIGVIFLCVAQTMAGVLQGFGKLGIAVLSLAIGVAVKCAATWYLAGIPKLNIEGAAIGSVLGFVTVAAVSFVAVQRITRIRFNFTLSVVKPLIAGIIMGVLVFASYKGISFAISDRLATVVSICIGAAAYGVTLLKIKAIVESEIVMLPKGAKLVLLLKKLRLI